MYPHIKIRPCMYYYSDARPPAMTMKEGESRPVVVEFGSELEKWKVLERKLDLSREEREVAKNKRVERKKQKEREREEGGIRGRELSGRNRDGRGRELKVVFKNVRKIRNVVKQRECLAYTEKERVDICGINESSLNDDEFVDGGEGYMVWV
ncbi:hypothetical protein CAPTEDRAFT_206961 [Capitella teleta]|uniref:Uncharacterized protein n=1 Tax=Capitella teleta TaxID=283909 RepID=R7URQ2_CAPTE|nr:hypothetical protein CAPTEDRAFT_206961 [Capitella teleta]|eukprot:ELU08890.1 hypothetical protein CAPTEDRAFT_206961 [Capitella teleta]